MVQRMLKTVVGVALACAFGGSAIAQDSKVADELAKYREALADGNPADLLEVKGESLWTEKRGPKNASLEQCDMGLGPGKLEGAYASLPKYFKDTNKVMDVESRLVHCMVTLQGFTPRRTLGLCYADEAARHRTGGFVQALREVFAAA